jgi:hypothetical protein
MGGDIFGQFISCNVIKRYIAAPNPNLNSSHCTDFKTAFLIQMYRHGSQQLQIH